MVVTNSEDILALELTDVARAFADSDNNVSVLEGATLSVERGEIVAVVGASGSGKSTLLHIAGALDKPDRGSVALRTPQGITDIAHTSDEQLVSLRNKVFGFVFQFHHLLQEFSAVENIALPALIAGRKRSEALQLASDLLDQVQLSHRADAFPNTLSGGEAQRVAIARALVNKPAFVLADEPTGNLDAANASTVVDLMFDIVRKHQTGFLVVTHAKEIADRCDRVLEISDGVIRAT